MGEGLLSARLRPTLAGVELVVLVGKLCEAGRPGIMSIICAILTRARPGLHFDKLNADSDSNIRKWEIGGVSFSSTIETPSAIRDCSHVERDVKK